MGPGGATKVSFSNLGVVSVVEPTSEVVVIVEEEVASEIVVATSEPDDPQPVSNPMTTASATQTSNIPLTHDRLGDRLIRDNTGIIILQP